MRCLKQALKRTDSKGLGNPTASAATVGPMAMGDTHKANGADGVVVFCPMRIERSHVERALRLAGLGSVRAVQTGIGKDAVVRALAREEGKLFILAGACGGLVECGDVPGIARVVDEGGRSWTPWGAYASGVTLAAVDRIVSTPGEKRALAGSTGAVIVDMESHAFAAACEARGVAWTVVRGVSDTPEQTLPGEVMGWITPEGETRMGRAVWDMLRRPWLVAHIMGIVKRSNQVLPQVGRRVAEVVRAWEASGMRGTI